MTEDDSSQLWLVFCSECCESGRGDCPGWCGCNGERALTPEECWSECSGDMDCYEACVSAGRAFTGSGAGGSGCTGGGLGSGSVTGRCLEECGVDSACFWRCFHGR